MGSFLIFYSYLTEHQTIFILLTAHTHTHIRDIYTSEHTQRIGPREARDATLMSLAAQFLARFICVCLVSTRYKIHLYVYILYTYISIGRLRLTGYRLSRKKIRKKENIFGKYIKIIVCYAMHEEANTHTLIECECACVCVWPQRKHTKYEIICMYFYTRHAPKGLQSQSQVKPKPKQRRHQ